MQKLPIAILEINYEVIIDTCKNPDDFATTWKKYLENNGWTEYEYELEKEKQLYNSAN